jgi:hypothetical protein
MSSKIRRADALATPTIGTVRRTRPFPIGLLSLVAGLAGLAWWAPWTPGPVAPIAFTAEGERTLGPICLAVMIDESGSMSDSDPEQSRAAALLGAASFLDRYGLPQDRIAGGWFADDASISGLMDGATGTRRLPERPTVPSGGGTNMAAAMNEAGRVLHSCHPATRPVLTLVTDGQADDLDAVAQALDRLPPDTLTQLIAIDATGVLGRAEQWRRAAPQVAITTVRSLDRRGIGDGIATSLSALTGQRVLLDDAM